MKIIEYIPYMWKAVAAFILSLTSEYALVQVDGVTWGEHGYVWGTAAAVAFGAWVVENKKRLALKSSEPSQGTTTW